MANETHEGLHSDIEVFLNRRRLLGMVALVSTSGVLLACGGPPSNPEPNKIATAADGSTCIKDPAETNGPYPADGTNSKAGQTVNVLTESGVKRADIRDSFGGLAGKADGIETKIAITLVNVGKACESLAGHVIYVWHCDREGKYSLYDLPDRNYLRGVAVTDAKGQATFTTVFPGCYAGRWPHIHFEVFANEEHAASGKDSLLVSQFALPQDICAAVYASAEGYAASAGNLKSSPFESDGIFRDNTAQQNAAMTLKMIGSEKEGFAATVTVGIVTA